MISIDLKGIIEPGFHIEVEVRQLMPPVSEFPLIQLPAMESAPIAVAAKLSKSSHRQSRTAHLLINSFRIRNEGRLGKSISSLAVKGV